jgi:hypothetical protein
MVIIVRVKHHPKCLLGFTRLIFSCSELFKAMGLEDNSRSLIIPMNLCSIKNMIQLFNLDLHENGNLFSLQDHLDSVFQDFIIKLLCLGKCFELLFEEKFVLDDFIEVPNKFIQSTFEEETNFLGSDTN